MKKKLLPVLICSAIGMMCQYVYADDSSSAGVTAASSYAGSSTVDDRTGQLNFSKAVASLSNHGLEDDYRLSVLYSQAELSDSSPYYLANHWQLALPYYDNNTFYSGNGASYYVTSTVKDATTGMYRLNFAYNQIHNVELLASSSSNPTVLEAIYDDNHVEIYQSQNDSSYLLLSEIIYPSGLKLAFKYSKIGDINLLTSITNSYDESIKLSYNSGSGYTISGSDSTSTQMSLDNDDQLTMLKQLSADGVTMAMQLFSYYTSSGSAGSLSDNLIKNVTQLDSNGTEISSTGIGYGAIEVKSSTKTFVLPVVTSLCNFSDSSKQSYTQTFYSYGQTEPDSYYTTNSCANDPGNAMAIFTGNNYTGYPLTNATSSATDNANLFAQLNHTAFTYSVNKAVYSSDDPATPVSQESDYYDHLQRLINSVVWQGQVETQTAYGFADGMTTSFTVADNNTTNQAETTFSDNVTPSSNTYAEAKTVVTKTTANGNSFQKVNTVSYDDYGNVVSSYDSATGTTTLNQYARNQDASCMYVNADAITYCASPVVSQKITSDGTWTTVSNQSEVKAKAPDGTSIIYYPVSASFNYFKAGDSDSHIIASTDTTDADYGDLLSETDTTWGNSDQNQEARKYAESTIDHTVDSLKVTSNKGDNLTITPVSTQSVDYSYCDSADPNLSSCADFPDSYGTTVETKVPLSQGATDSVITSQKVYNNHSGLLTEDVSPMHIDTQDGLKSVVYSYDGLHRPLSEKTYAISSISEALSDTDKIGDIDYSYPSLLEKVTTDNIMGYESDTVYDSRGNQQAVFDNAYSMMAGSPGGSKAAETCDDSSGVSHTASGLCPVNQTVYNALGNKIESIAYNQQDAAGNTAYTTVYLYDTEQRLISQTTTPGSVTAKTVTALPESHLAVSQTAYVDVWNDSVLDKDVSLKISDSDAGNISDSLSNSHPPISVEETDLNTGNAIADYDIDYADDFATDPAAYVEAAIVNKTYYNKTETNYNGENEAVSVQSLDPGSASYSSDHLITSNTYYDAQGQSIQSQGPVINTTLTDSDMSSDLTGKQITLFTHYNGIGKSICMAEGVSQTDDACSS
ncbi:MAG: hypothetical protein ACO2ZM_08750 [Francisellaceae bacterium]